METAAITERQRQMQPVDLSTVPEVDELLVQLGLGKFNSETIRSFPGRNDNWFGATSQGAQVVVKRIIGPESQERFDRCLAFESAAAKSSSTSLRAPRLVGSDAGHRLLVFEQVPDVITGFELAADDAFPEELAVRSAEIVADIHSLPIEEIDTSVHPLPPVSNLDGLSVESYLSSSGALLDMWKLYHSDAELTRSLYALRATDTPEMRTCVIHGDLRLDQFLVVGEDLYITDFEEVRMGDPARDVGAFAGEWLYQSVTRIPGRLADTSAFGHVATHEEILATGAAEIELVRPYVRSFFRTYVSARAITPDVACALAERAGAYAGWHMLDRMLATARHNARLSPISRAAAGIGRALLLDPAHFLGTLGLDLA